MTLKHIQLRRWNPSRLTNLPIILCVGPRNSGKTTLAHNIMYHLAERKKFDYVLAFCGTRDTEDATELFLPAANVFSEYDEKKVETMYEMAKIGKTVGRARRILLYLDDLTFDKSTMQSVIMRQIHMNGRHDNVGLIACSHYVMDIPIAQRDQIEYVFVFQTVNRDVIKRLWRQFFGMFSRLRDFENALHRCTQNFECLVLDKSNHGIASSTNSSVCDLVYFFRGKYPVPSFQLCRPIFWKLSQKYRKSKLAQAKAKERELFTVGHGNSGDAQLSQTMFGNGNMTVEKCGEYPPLRRL